jgi:2',3'-cyclic-nucleotide 2'-phosphodiesterase (5'-nucleotidase family)
MGTRDARILLLLAATSCGATRRPPIVGPPAADRQLTLAYTGDAWGEVGPCGCPRHPMGGFAPEAGLVELWRSQGTPVLLLDSGDLLAPPGLLASGVDEARERAAVVLDILAKMGLGAAVPGEADLALGPALLRDLAAREGVLLLAANLTDSAGTALFPGSTVERVGDVDVGIVGVLSPSLCPPELRATDPATAARAGLAQLGRGQLRVVIAHEPEEEDASLAAALPEADVLIGGHGGVPEPTRRLPGTRAVRARPGNKNRFLGKLEVRLGPNSPLGFAGHLVALDDSLPIDAAVEESLRRYRKAADARELARLTPGLAATAENSVYAGEDACERCHAGAAQVWHAAAHAHAYATLEQKGHALDPDCIGCHTVGWQQPGGYSQPAAVGFLENVQCEACHGPGKAHLADPKAPYPPPAQGEALCRRCHTEDRSPQFVYATYHERIQHAGSHR